MFLRVKRLADPNLNKVKGRNENAKNYSENRWHGMLYEQKPHHMNAFLNLYYDNGLNDSSRIFLSETATDVERRAVIDQYNGDFGGSLNVQIHGKTVSLDIYDLTHDQIRLMDENADKLPLGDDGAYVCMRLSETFGLSVGDTFAVSPFGTDDI